MQSPFFYKHLAREACRNMGISFTRDPGENIGYPRIGVVASAGEVSAILIGADRCGRALPADCLEQGDGSLYLIDCEREHKFGSDGRCDFGCR